MPLQQWSLSETGVQYSGVFEEAQVAQAYDQSLAEFYGRPVEERELMIATVRSQARLSQVLELRAAKARKP